jgi:hypothetical protein
MMEEIMKFFLLKTPLPLAPYTLTCPKKIPKNKRQTANILKTIRVMKKWNFDNKIFVRPQKRPMPINMRTLFLSDNPKKTNLCEL